jgi:hypothetical protein
MVRLFEYSGEGQLGHGKGRLARCLPGGVAAFHDPDDFRIAIGAEGPNAFRELDGEETEAVCLALGVKGPEGVERLGAAFVVETVTAMRKAARLSRDAAKRLAAERDPEPEPEPAPRKAKPRAAARAPLSTPEEG